MKNSEETNIHAGHREQLRKLYLSNGLDALGDHQVLELILTFSVPRVDVNPTAHRLMEHFGSLHAVFDASFDELTQVDGIGPSSAALVTLFRQTERRYHIDEVSRQSFVRDVTGAGKMLAPYFIGEQEEVVYGMTVAPSGKLLRCSLLFRGTVDTSVLCINQIVTLAMSKGAAGVILAHNHPHGVALPSKDDIESTLQIARTLDGIGSTLVDHLIFADNDFVSMSDSGYLDTLKKRKP